MSATLTHLSLAWIVCAVATGLLLLRVPAPYGRHRRAGWGPEISDRVGWILMELVSPVALAVSVVLSPGDLSGLSLALGACWLVHYGYRAVLHPVRHRTRDRRMPVAVMLSAVVFNAVNGSLNGLALTAFDPPPAIFAVGMVLWLVGFTTHVHADETLRRLRRDAPTGYAIPRGGLFRRVSCPNYLGEIVEWGGFALAAWNPAALSFAVWTVANLLPRALAHHRWYRDRFPDYPASRKALVPGVI